MEEKVEETLHVVVNVARFILVKKRIVFLSITRSHQLSHEKRTG